MTTVLEPPPTHRAADEPDTNQNYAEASSGPPIREGGRRLRHQMAAVRLSFHWPGVRKTLTRGQKATAADAFGAAGDSISAGKKLIDTSHPSWKACTAVRSQTQKFWQGMTLPWPEPGIRLIRRDDVEPFDARMNVLRAELEQAARTLEADFEELKEQARQRLGELYDLQDYPHKVATGFGVEWNYPGVEAPEYLRELCPSLYAEEQRRVAARFEEAVRLAESAFAEELSGLVEHLANRLSGSPDGKPKVFRDSAVENLAEFFERFGRLNISGSEQLETVVADARSLLQGLDPQRLRDSATSRRAVADGLARVQSSLDGLLVDRPRRRVIRR